MAESATLQTVMAGYLDGFSKNHRLSAHQWQVCHHVLDCRTAALGGMQLLCDHCADTPVWYHACRDRHCPRCQRKASDDWCARQQAAVVPVTYHHLVFTLPHVLNPWVQLHPEVIYALLFEAVWATLRAFGTDPKRLDGQLGMTAVLHTWGQTLIRHVHLHCLLPGGAFSDQGQWHPAKSTYLFPVRALSRHFRGRFVSRLRQRLDNGDLPQLTDSTKTDAMLDTLMDTEWVVYSKPCLTHTDTVVRYLARYSHRIALGDGRLLGLDDDQVQLDYKDYRDQGRHKVMCLSASELIRRFLLHVLPKGMMRIRHYGFLANCCRSKRLPMIRQAIEAVAPQDSKSQTQKPTEAEATGLVEGYPCPKCHKGHLKVIEWLAPQRDEGG